ncbi:hypothetical protein ACRRTK_014329 [Alexandromys fortis]
MCTPPTGPQNQPQPCQRPSTKAPKRGHSQVPGTFLGDSSIGTCPCDPAPVDYHRQLAGPFSDQQTCCSPSSASYPARCQQVRPPAWAQSHSSLQCSHNLWLNPGMWGHTPHLQWATMSRSSPG